LKGGGLSSLLPLWEKVARTQSATDEGFVSAERTPYPSALRADTLSHKGRGKKETQNAAASSLAPGRLLIESIRLSVTANSFATVLWWIATGLRS
jgi:hypothetical protein